jgi:hypothetical protein
MSPFDLSTFPEGEIGFAGSVRGADECGHDLFQIQLQDRPLFFGKWDSIFEPDGNSFNVEIFSFGYKDKYNAPIMHPNARAIFSITEKQKIVALINHLFNNTDKRQLLLPFSMKNANYLGQIIFGPYWIITNHT